MRTLLAFILLFICISCSTTKYVEVPVEVENIKTEYITQYSRDSVFVHDSIDRYIAGDTVLVTKYKYTYKYMTNTDTIIKNDSIQVPVYVKTTEIQEVNKIKWYQSVLMWLGIIFIIVLAFKFGKYLKSKQMI